jgi:hypothetical protein
VPSRTIGYTPFPMILVPVIVRPVAGRSGSTLVMQLLGTSPLIAFERIPPYEHRYLRYLLARTLAMLPDEDVPSAAAEPGGSTRRKAYRGDEPLPPSARIFSVRELVELSIVRQWEAFSEAVVREAGIEAAPVYYAEKFVDVVDPTAADAPPIASELIDLPMKVIWLVRDPRDVWASINAFDEMRGYYGFGRREGESREDYLERYIGRANRFTEAATARGEEDVLVRYEDLVADPIPESKRIGAWLSVTLDPGLLSRPDGHGTSASAEGSIGRWRQDLPSGERDRLNAGLAGALDAFGYSR